MVISVADVILSQHALLTRPTGFVGMELALKAAHITIFYSIGVSKLQCSYLNTLVKGMSINTLYVNSFSQLHILLRVLGNYL